MPSSTAATVTRIGSRPTLAPETVSGTVRLRLGRISSGRSRATDKVRSLIPTETQAAPMARPGPRVSDSSPARKAVATT